MTSYRLVVMMFALVACQHSQAAEPKSTPAALEPTAPPKGLADKTAKEAAAKAIAALPACKLEPTGGVVSGQLRITAGHCTELRCIRTCCNRCSYVAVVAGNGPQRGLSAAQVRQLFPAFPSEPLECEITAWNTELKTVTLGVTLPEEGAASAQACLQAAER